MSENLLEVKDLKTYFYTDNGVVKSVDGVSFVVKKGQTLGIVGESGCGKSITSLSIMQLIESPPGKIVGGEILFEGEDLLKKSKNEMRKIRGSKIAMIFQEPMTSLNPVFTVGQQIMEALKIHTGMDKHQAKEHAIEMLKLVRIPMPEKRFNEYPHQLSGGMCQRVIIAMAVCGHPKLIIADEPTTALDVTVQAQVLELLKDLQKKLNTAILLITHNLGVVWEMCDTVMVMYAGNTVEYADTKTLYKEPLHPYTWGLLDSMPKLSSSAKEDLKTIPGTPPDLRLTGYCCNFYNRCPYVTEICKQQVPPLKEVAPGHFVACHRQDGEHRLTRGEVNETCRKM